MKYSPQKVFMVNETADLYASKTEPWIDALDPKKYDVTQDMTFSDF